MESVDFAATWRIAARELGIRVTTPFRVAGAEGSDSPEFIALVHDFGNQAGTLLVNAGDDTPAHREAAALAGCFLSILNPRAYSQYHRELFIDTLNDWGYFGHDAAPDWYT